MDCVLGPGFTFRSWTPPPAPLPWNLPIIVLLLGPLEGLFSAMVGCPKTAHEAADWHANQHHPDLPFLPFFGIPCFSPFPRNSLFFQLFPLLSQRFWGFAKDKKSLFFWWFSLPFSKKARKGSSGHGLNGPFPSLMGRFRSWWGVSPISSWGAVLPLENPLENGPFLKKRDIKKFLKVAKLQLHHVAVTPVARFATYPKDHSAVP